MRKPRGFTLLELLVVITILTLLLVILFPTYSYVRQMAKRTTCLYNIKQICLAMKNYAVKFGGALTPDYGGYQNSGNPPWGALVPTDSNKYLNPFLAGEGYKVLQCPADQNTRAGSEMSLFQTQGYSYWYACQDNKNNMAISTVEGNVLWQENPIGDMPSTNQMLVAYLNMTGYYGTGPETVTDPCAKDSNGNYLRARDVTQAQLYQANGTSDMWHTIVLPGLAAMAAQFQNNPNGVYLNPGGLWVPYQIMDAGNPSGVSGQLPNTKWVSEYNGSTGMPTSMYPPPNLGRWAQANPWGRNVYYTDYWRAPSKKVCVLDCDATFQYNTPGNNNTSVNDTYPTVGQGFWHAYPYTPDPNAPTDLRRYRVSVHAGFLDGHAAPIQVNQVTGFDGNNNPIYMPIDRNNNPYY